MNELNSPKNKFYAVKKCELCGITFESLIKRQQRFCGAKCSSVSTANNEGRISKIKKTKLQRYGSETYVNPEKSKQTCMERYGVDNVSKSDKVIAKIKDANVKKYGKEWSFQSEDVKEKIRTTNLERYGVENASQSDKVKEKVKSTVRNKYGTDNVFQNESVKEKIYETNLIRYGTKIPVNSEKIKSEMVKRNRVKIWEKLKSNTRISELVTMQFSSDEYINTDRINKYHFKCNKCGVVFEDHIDGGHLPRCLTCFPYISGFSFMEKEIVVYIQSLIGTDMAIREKCRNTIDGELDIVIPDKNIAIEFNGTYWHSELAGKKHKNYHLNKTVQCLNKGIQLIHIFEDEWAKKESIVKDRIRHILGKNTKDKIHARSCEVVEISSKDCNDFLEKHHLQGKCNSSVKLALFFKGKMVSVMTFGKYRISLGKRHSSNDEYEMYRHCSSNAVNGGSSKLLHYFIEKYKPSKITTYADRRWSVGNLYEKLGFTQNNPTPPNYFYIKYGKSDRLHRYNFTKHRLKDKLEKYDESLSEWQNMQLNGYDRIWDCGHLKFEWNKR